MDRCIGLEARVSSCTPGIVGPGGKRLGSQVVETNARALIEVLRGIPRNRQWLAELPEAARALAELLYAEHDGEGAPGGIRDGRRDGVARAGSAWGRPLPAPRTGRPNRGFPGAGATALER